jgi:aquaporin Z
VANPAEPVAPPPRADRPESDRLADWPRRLTAEAFGTFGLVFAAAGGDVMAAVSHDAIGTAARAIAPGLMVAALIYSIGDTSGAHFNPVVTLAFGVKRLVPAAWLVPYWLAQLVGAIVAAAVLRAVFGTGIDEGVTRPKLVDPAGTIVIEAILTLLLLTVILGTADRFRVVGPNAALAVGATIALAGLIALPIEGASMNPARSLGPAIVAGRLGSVWLYLVGPAIGALAAVGLTTFLHGRTDDDGKAEEAARGSG